MQKSQTITNLTRHTSSLRLSGSDNGKSSGRPSNSAKEALETHTRPLARALTYGAVLKKASWKFLLQSTVCFENSGWAPVTTEYYNDLGIYLVGEGEVSVVHKLQNKVLMSISKNNQLAVEAARTGPYTSLLSKSTISPSWIEVEFSLSNAQFIILYIFCGLQRTKEIRSLSRSLFKSLEQHDNRRNDRERQPTSHISRQRTQNRS